MREKSTIRLSVVVEGVGPVYCEKCTHVHLVHESFARCRQFQFAPLVVADWLAEPSKILRHAQCLEAEAAEKRLRELAAAAKEFVAAQRAIVATTSMGYPAKVDSMGHALLKLQSAADAIAGFDK